MSCINTATDLDNSITRERIYNAPLERVWNAVATAPGLETWFCKRVEGELKAGERVRLTFRMEGEVGGDLQVVECEPMSRLAWRWHPGQIDGCNWEDFPESEATLVTFTFQSIPEGTLLKVLETGFENLPESRRASVHQLNGSGWTEVMDMIGDAVSA